MTGLKSNSSPVERGRGKRNGSEPDVRSELRWLHRRIEELGAGLIGHQHAAGEITDKGEEIIRFASETSGTILYDLALESGRFRMIYGVREKLGFDPEEVALDRHWWREQIHPEDRQGVEAQFARAVESGSGCRLRYRIRRKDGRYVPVEDVMKTSASGWGPPESAVGCIIDAPQPSPAEEPVPRIGLKGGPAEEEERKRYAQKLESVNRDLQNLTSIASYNLLDPLRKIRVFGEMVASKCSNSGEVPEYLSRMQNAFQAGDKRPHIRIHAEAAVGDRPGMRRLWRILVEDNGIGFEETHGEEIFSPFQRLHGGEEYEGVGMGLAISRKIVDRHGGSITAKSAVGKGSTFLVTFPRRER